MSKTEVNANVAPEQKRTVPTGGFVMENQKSLLFIGAAIVALIAIYIAYQKLYLAPREVEAANQMHVAQGYWDKKEWDKALKGDASYPGFEKIMADYSNTKAANLAYYYAGVAYLNKGEFGKAIENLNNFRSDDNMVAAEALGSVGDAYVELKKYDEAESSFKKAVDKANNKFLSPFYLKKLGLVQEALKDYAGAAESYNKIKSDYPASAEAQSIDAYIGRVEAKQ
ncbi:tetratricopeptide repeat protein [Mucilaginibacter daejeonensis]|uniref:tetratricopeptide repeat protein n=1 Tax=Mucilaginibacter daejeonensis TaxID=398049 RepID=UPI001D172174|nr:tetratricopeptide repeat protein [Mucilaginibacter daejeonensis]UEG52788.1 tetratricopeptide repeat protein [Mucilaginibacter daejeonensis]